jgi:integrase
VKPALGSLKVQQVSRGDVGKLHRSLRDTPYQANRVRNLLSKMMNLAEKWGLRPDGSNPCRHIEQFRERRRERFLTEPELAALADLLAKAEQGQTVSDSVIAAVRLLLFTGARLSEILTLRWEHVEIQERCIRLPDSKTGAKTIYLAAPALEVLTSTRRIEGNPFVITGTREGAHFTDLEKPWRRLRALTTVQLWAASTDKRIAALVARLTADLKRDPTVAECRAVAKEAEIELPAGLLDVRLHDLRHSFASIAGAGGLSLPMIGALLGHTQAQTTKRYTHLVGHPMKQAAEIVGQRIVGAMKGKGGEVVTFPEGRQPT